MMLKMMKIAMLASAAFPRAFMPAGQAGWKMDGDKLALDADGNPIYINSAGAEQSVKGDTIATLNAEARTHRTAKETAEAALAKYRGPDGKPIDPEAAVKAIETVSKIDAKTLIDAGEVDKVRETIKAEYTGLITEKDTALKDALSQIDNLNIDKVFSNSDFVREQLAMPRDFFEGAMRSHFKREEGKIVAYDRSGNRLMSKKSPGDYADPEEALHLLVEMHPQKDTILKAPAGGGTGNGGGGGGRGGGRIMKRAEFDQLQGGDAAAAAAAMGKGELTIAD